MFPLLTSIFGAPSLGLAVVLLKHIHDFIGQDQIESKVYDILPEKLKHPDGPMTRAEMHDAIVAGAEFLKAITAATHK